jgi:HAD superfamily hydrolase (TIGR01662 family)
MHSACLSIAATAFFRNKLDMKKHKVALVTNQGGVGLRHWMTQGKWGKPEQYPSQEKVEKRLNRILDQVRQCFSGEVQLYSCFRFVSKAGKEAPRPVNSENDPRWNAHWRKPNPGMLQAAMKHFEVQPDETIFVGDMETDRDAAQNSGISDFFFAKDFFR